MEDNFNDRQRLLSLPRILKPCKILIYHAAQYWLLRLTVLDPMKMDAIEMERLDPSVIISVPYDAERLFRLVSYSLIFTLTMHRFTGGGKLFPLSRIKSALAPLTEIGCLSALFFACCVLCGASPQVNIWNTFLLSVYLSTISFGTVMFEKKDVPVAYFFFRQKAMTEKTHPYGCWGVVLGSALGSVLLPLDWGAQIQRWPVSILLGGWIGSILGSCLGLFVDNVSDQA